MGQMSLRSPNQRVKTESTDPTICLDSSSSKLLTEGHRSLYARSPMPLGPVAIIHDVVMIYKDA